MKKSKKGKSELRPEFIAKMRRIEKEGNFIWFKSIDELKKAIESGSKH